MESNLFEVSPSRKVDNANFPLGIQEYAFSVGVPNVWHPSKSYFRVGMTLYGAPLAGPAVDRPRLREMVAFADNAVGNMFDNAYLKSNNVEISGISQGLPQASALHARIGNGYAWSNSLGKSTGLHDASFDKRCHLTASGSHADAFLGTKNEMYRPTDDDSFIAAEVSIAAATGVVTGTNTLFETGMPSVVSNLATGEPTGGDVRVGDVLVVNGIHYEVFSEATDEFTFTVQQSGLLADVADTEDWYIIRKDMIRAPQAANTVYAVWQPPMGIFSSEEGLGSGNFVLQLNPNSNYLLTAVETKNPQAEASTNGLSGTYSIVVNDVKFYAYMEKVRIPDSVQDLTLMEYQVQSKPWANTLQFSVSPYTTALSIFIQDVTAGNSPLVPPSMFKVLDNSDSKLQTLQVSYAGINKTSTPWTSNFFNGANQLQQRYRECYEETGMSVKDSGAETYYDWLQRGPLYHYSFVRDESSRADQVSITTTFSNLINGPGTGTGGTGLARIFLVSHYPRRIQVTTAAGMIVQVSARNS